MSKLKGGHGLPLFLATLLIAALIPPAEPSFAQERPAESKDVQEFAPPDDPPPPPTEADRKPIPAYEEVGETDPKPVLPVEQSADNPAELIDDAKPLPKEGGENFDLYSFGPDDTEHLALVYPDVVNEKQPDGDWVDLDKSFSQDEDGWVGSRGDVKVHFPKALSLKSPVTYETPEGSISLAPVGVEGIAGLRDGEAITYPDALSATDLRYELTAHGYKEDIVLKTAEAKPALTYQVETTGLSLVYDGHGQIEVSSKAGPVGVIPTPAVTDSSDLQQETVGAYTLVDLGEGRYLLELSLDPTFLVTAKYPVTIDPALDQYNAIRYANRDGYVYSGSPNSSYESSTQLKVGGAYHSFVRFDTSALQRVGRLVYNADLALYNESQSNSSAKVDVRTVQDPWPATLTWNNKPGAGSNVWDSRTGPTLDWWYFHIEEIYQHYINESWTDHGIRLSSTDNKTFLSENIGGNGRPVLKIVYNDLPPAPTLASPATNVIVETESPTLKIDAIPNDLNGDEVHVQFQISDNANFTGSPVYESPWVDEKSFVVPAGALTDGQTYWWRARTWDRCSSGGTEGYCPLVNGAGTTQVRQASGVRKLTVSLKHFGDEERWSMWSQPLGNDMTLKVHESNGNLYLDVPLDSVTTPAGNLDIGLSYNSQQEANFGLGPGWDLAIGPSSSARELPVRLTELTPAPDMGIRIRFRDGSQRYFPHRNRRTYAGIGASADMVRKNPDESFTYNTSDGGIYTFNANGTLRRAKPATTTDASGKAFSYTFNASDQLTKVTDPMGREVTLTWGPDHLEEIRTWDNRTWVIFYSFLEPPLLRQPVSITTPGGERMSFSYASELLSGIRDGQQYADGQPGWTVSYQTLAPGSDPYETTRVDKITPASSTSYWDFDYSGPYKGATVATAKITDPRGVATATPTNDYQRIVDFNYAGLPIRVAGPADQTGYWPLTKMVWDTNNNLYCKRSPAANAYQDGCSGTGNTGPLTTVYSYQDHEPYRLLTVTHPFHTPGGAGERLTETYSYDEGFTGLVAEVFGSPNLAGIPADEGIWGDLNRSWGTGQPVSIGDGDWWSVRVSGQLHINAADDKKYKFRLYSDDGATLVIGNTVITDCFGSANVTFADYNCGTSQPVTKRLWPGSRNITLEFQERTGEARFKLEWDQGNGNWEVLPATRLRPNLGVLTTETGPRAEIVYDYADGASFVRRLPASETTRSFTPGEGERKTAYTYDDYGRVLTTTTAAGTSLAATTTNLYTDPPQNIWNATCPSRTTDPTGAVTDRYCNAAGDVTATYQQVRAVGSQPSQTRVTQTVYDPLGRVLQQDPPGDAKTVNTYDKAGRLKTKDVLVSSSPETHAITTYTYDAAGRLKTETLPDPDGSGPLASPVITHSYDLVGNEISVTDARNSSWLWQREYDAHNRVTASITPSNLRTTTTYRLLVDPFNPWNPWTGDPIWVNDQIVTDPAGVRTATKFDVLGRKVSEKLGTLNTTTYTYDVLGNVISITDPAGITTTQSYNAFGEVKQERHPHAAEGSIGVDSITNYTYNAAGDLTQTNGPRTEVNDVHDYTYDRAGRLLTVTLSGIAAIPVGPQATFEYNDAGERVRVTNRMSPTQSMTRNYVYDENGRLKTYNDGLGTTTHTYNAAGWLTQTADPRGQTLNYVYDNLGRQIRRYGVKNSQEIDSETFKYDAAGNIIEAKNAFATTTLGFDSDARPTSVVQGTATTTYGYAATTGLLASVSDPAGATSYTYDANGLLRTLTDPLTGIAHTYDYDAAGRAWKRTSGGLVWERGFDAVSGRLETQTVKQSTSTLASFTLDYDKAGNVATKAQTVPGSTDNGTWTYTYDAADRLQNATDPAGVLTTYAYDEAGNRTSVKIGAQPAVTTTYGSSGVPTSSSDGTTFTHDAIGNLLTINRPGSNPDVTYVYDSYGRTKNGTVGATSVAYKYDALSRTIERNQGGAITTYAYPGQGEDVAKATAGATVTTYAHSPGGPLAQKQGTAVRLFVKDLHGDVVGLTTTAGAVLGTTSYSPWGQRRSSTGESSFLGFQGDPTDPTTGLVDMTARNYDPTLGRFVTRDVLFGEPLSPMSLNQYVYGADDPVSNTDLTGLCPDPDVCPSVETQKKSGDARARRQQQQSSGSGSTSVCANGCTDSRIEHGTYEPTRPTTGPVSASLSFVNTVNTVLKAMSAAADAVRGLTVASQSAASEAGRILGSATASRTARQRASSVLNRWKAVKSATSRLGVRLAMKGLPLLAFGAEVAENVSEGDDPEDAVVKAGGSVGGGIIGARVALAACALPFIGTAACVAAVVAGGGLGSKLGGRVASELSSAPPADYHFSANDDFNCGPDSAFHYVADSCP